MKIEGLFAFAYHCKNGLKMHEMQQISLFKYSKIMLSKDITNGSIFAHGNQTLNIF